jgi:hypothetical protein
LTFPFRDVYFFAGVHVRAENVFDWKLFSQSQWFENEWFMDLLRTKLLRRVYRRISQCYCWRKTFEDNLSRCVKLFGETGGLCWRRLPKKNHRSAAKRHCCRYWNCKGNNVKCAPHFNTSVIATNWTLCRKVGTWHKLLRKDVQLYPYCMTVVIESNFHDFKINFLKLIAGFRQYKCSKVSTENFGTIFWGTAKC